MINEILSYFEMCQREGTSLQKGMNFAAQRDHSVVLMSRRSDAPYADRIEDDGQTLIYEGHNAAKNHVDGSPSLIDQPERIPSGGLTENGRFLEAARHARDDGNPPRLVRVYEKLKKGIWSYNGEFLLMDAWTEDDGQRRVFKFKMVIAPSPTLPETQSGRFEHNRMIPPAVKLAVYRRDQGQCVLCGESTGLHFDHVLAYSRGGSSVTEENIQLLCARHNLEKGARIE